MSADVKVVLLGLLNAALLTAGVAFQKLNGVRGGNPLYGPWIIVAFLCLAPTFFIGNAAFWVGGRITLFVPVTAVAYILIGLVGHFFFGEPLGARELLGFLLIFAGVALVATNQGPKPASTQPLDSAAPPSYIDPPATRGRAVR